MMRISENDLTGLRNAVIAARDAAAAWDMQTAGIRPMRMIRRRTGETCYVVPMSRDDYEGPSVDRQGPDVDDRRLMGQEVGRNVPEYDQTLIAVDTEGNEVLLDISAGITLVQAGEAIEWQRHHLEIMASSAEAAVETWERRIADGTAIVSPTAAEEAATTARRRRETETRYRHQRLTAALSVLRVLVRDEAAYRANGHDIDRMLAEARRDVQDWTA